MCALNAARDVSISFVTLRRPWMIEALRLGALLVVFAVGAGLRIRYYLASFSFFLMSVRLRSIFSSGPIAVFQPPWIMTSGARWAFCIS